MVRNPLPVLSEVDHQSGVSRSYPGYTIAQECDCTGGGAMDHTSAYCGAPSGCQQSYIETCADLVSKCSRGERGRARRYDASRQVQESC